MDEKKSPFSALSHEQTETIEIDGLFTRDVTSSGSFDITSGIWTTTFGRLMQALPSPALLVDRSLRVVVANEACSKIDKDFNKLLDRPFSQLFSDAGSGSQIQSILERVFSTRKAQRITSKVKIESKVRWLHMAFRSIRIAQERFVLLLIEDLTAEKKQLVLQQKYNEQLRQEISYRKKSEHDLLEARDDWQRTFDAVPDAIMILDEDHRIRRMNRAQADLLGVDQDEAVGMRCYELAHSTREIPEYCPCPQMLASGRDHAVEVYEEQWQKFMKIAVSPIWDAKGNMVGYVHVSSDVTEQRRARESLRQSEQRYRDMVEMSDDIVYQTDPRGVFTFVNRIASRASGFSEEELLGLRYTELILPEYRLAADKFYGRQFVKRIPNTYYEFPFRTKDGEVLWVGQNVQLITRDDEVVGFQAIARDITRGKIAEKALRESEERYRVLADNSLVGVYLHQDSFFIYVNRRLEEMLGYSADELSKMRFWEVFHPDIREEVRERGLARYLGDMEPSRYVARVVTKGGETKWAEVTAVSTQYRGRPATTGAAIDITDRKRAEESLQESESRYRDLFENAIDMIYTHDLEGNYTSVNEAATRLFGYSKEEFLKLNFRDLIAPEYLAIALEQFGTKLDRKTDKTGPYEIKVLTRHGSPRWVEVVSRIVREKGSPVRVHGVARDVSERKLMEDDLRQAKDAAEAANRAKSEFLARMSHEIRTPINGIVGMTELALSTALTAEQRKYLESVTASADTLLRLIDDILDFSRIEAGRLDLEPAAFNLRDCMREAISPLEVQANSKGLELVCQVSPYVPEVLVGDKGRLTQVLVNLVSNAIKFTQKGGVLVDVGPESADGDELSLLFGISDTGIGVSPENAKRIFHAFEQAEGSSRRLYKGAGLGLAISMDLVSLMGGRIWLDTKVQEGSTFYFTAVLGLRTRGTESGSRPQGASQGAVGLGDLGDSAIHVGELDGKTSEQTADRKEFPVSSRPLNILLVEDTEINRVVARKMLTKMGHTVTVAADGREAVSRHREGGFDLILMDVQMPEMDGIEATAIIRRRESSTGEHVPIIAMTAHALTGDREKLIEAGMDGYIAKPVKSATLYETIESFAQARK